MSRRDGAPVLVGQVASELTRLEFGAGLPNALDEAWLQKLIFEHPACLPIREIEPGFDELVAVCREMPTAHGPIDNVFVTRAGDIVIAETKLWRNPQARREVVAQALDYASCLLGMTYEAFESACLRADIGARVRPNSLFELVADPATMAEVDFVDAVSANLRRGRVVVLVVGDGIRAETETLAAALRSHAGLHFTFALVELGVYGLPEGNGLIVVPRTLARTVMIERGIVRIAEGRVQIEAPPAVAGTTARARGSITAEQFFEAMAARDPNLPDRLTALLEGLEAIGVYPEFRGALNLKWDPPSGKPVNLGYIQRNGQVWTNATTWSAPPASRLRLCRGSRPALGRVCRARGVQAGLARSDRRQRPEDRGDRRPVRRLGGRRNALRRGAAHTSRRRLTRSNRRSVQRPRCGIGRFASLVAARRLPTVVGGNRPSVAANRGRFNIPDRRAVIPTGRTVAMLRQATFAFAWIIVAAPAAALAQEAGEQSTVEELASEDEAASVREVLMSINCEAETIEKENDNLFEIDDAQCEIGQYDIKLDGEFNILSMTRD